MDDCIFCKIIAGEVPSTKVYEDEDVLAFLDIAPVNPGHTLVIPKAHLKDLSETDDVTAGKVIAVAKKVARALLSATGAGGFLTSFNTGAAAGQTVFHVHCHVIPRHQGDGHELLPQGSYGEGEAAAVAEKIKAALA